MANKLQDHEDVGLIHPGFPGPGYAGFGGSAGYSGSGAGGVSGGFAGGAVDEGPWRPAPNTLHDDRIEADLKLRLTQAADIDASQIEVRVQAGEVTLEGRIATREMKHQATALAERVPGVLSVKNRLHIDQPLLEELRNKLASG